MLSSKQKKCIELMSTGEFTQREIAQKINITEKTISTWKKKDEFIDELDNLVAKGIRSIAAKAFMTQRKLLDSKNEWIRFNVSKDILDRGGFKTDEKLKLDIEGSVPVVIVDDLGADDEDDEDDEDD